MDLATNEDSLINRQIVRSTQSRELLTLQSHWLSLGFLAAESAFLQRSLQFLVPRCTCCFKKTIKRSAGTDRCLPLLFVMFSLFLERLIHSIHQLCSQLWLYYSEYPSNCIFRITSNHVCAYHLPIISHGSLLMTMLCRAALAPLTNMWRRSSALSNRTTSPVARSPGENHVKKLSNPSQGSVSKDVFLASSRSLQSRPSKNYGEITWLSPKSPSSKFSSSQHDSFQLTPGKYVEDIPFYQMGKENVGKQSSSSMVMNTDPEAPNVRKDKTVSILLVSRFSMELIYA